MLIIFHNNPQYLLEKTNINSNVLSSLAKEEIEYPNLMDGEWFVFYEPESFIIGNYYFGINFITNDTECYIEIHIDNRTQIDAYIFNKIVEKIKNIINKEKIEVDLLLLQLVGDDKILSNFDYNFLIVLGFKRSCIYVEKELMKSNKSISDLDHNFIVRKYKESDYNNVISCLFDSHLLFLKLTGNVDDKSLTNLKRNIVDYYSPLKTENRFIYVVELNKQFIGHISFEITNNKASILDIYVIEEFQGKKILPELSKYLEIYCLQKGVIKLSGTVEPSEKTSSILESLKKDGYSITSQCFLSDKILLKE